MQSKSAAGFGAGRRRAEQADIRRRAGAAVPGGAALPDSEFDAIRAWIYEKAGINLSGQKKALVEGRLAPRLRHHGLRSYGEYFELLRSGAYPAEPQIAVDLLTTNETHFFRELKHFDFLRKQILARHPSGRMFRVWSAASSSGEEPYSIAMTLAAALGESAPWEVIASDLSTRVLERARSGHYSVARAKLIPGPLLQKYCLKGVGAQEGTILVEPRLRSRVQFAQINLIEALPRLGEFNVIFLRNVMIYFDLPTKQALVKRMLPHLSGGGYFMVGHSESLNGVNDILKSVQPSIYRKP